VFPYIPSAVVYMFTYLNDPSPKIVSGLRPANLKHDRFRRPYIATICGCIPIVQPRSSKEKREKRPIGWKIF